MAVHLFDLLRLSVLKYILSVYLLLVVVLFSPCKQELSLLSVVGIGKDRSGKAA
jgi:hypothetical protein